MTIIEDVLELQKHGKSETEIRAELIQRGNTAQQVNEAYAQLKIKDAVNGPSMSMRAPNEEAMNAAARNEPLMLSSPSMQGSPSQNSPSSNPTFDGMQPSMFIESQASSPGQSVPQINQSSSASSLQGYPSMSGAMGAMPAQDYGQGYQDYGGEEYQPYQEAVSSDIVAEVAEQVVSERLASMQERLEKAIDFRTIADARLTALEDRIIRIEQIMDRLQLSLLQRMGEYVQDVRDIKQELVETQKSFKALVPGLRNVIPDIGNPGNKGNVLVEKKDNSPNVPRTRSGFGLP